MKRLFQTRMKEGYKAIVRGKNEHGEYVVTHYNCNVGRQYRDSYIVGTYFTDDLQDACHTAVHMVWGFVPDPMFLDPDEEFGSLFDAIHEAAWAALEEKRQEYEYNLQGGDEDRNSGR